MLGALRNIFQSNASVQAGQEICIDKGVTLQYPAYVLDEQDTVL